MLVQYIARQVSCGLCCVGNRHTHKLLAICETFRCLLFAAENWVQPEKRERKQRVNYNQNHYFQNAMGAQGGR